MEANKKKMTGLVVSDKMDKTIVVAISGRRCLDEEGEGTR